MRAATSQGESIGLALAGACAVIGLILAVDGALQECLMRYRIAAFGISGVFVLPLGILMIFRQRGRRLLKLLVFALLPSLALVVSVDLALRFSGLGRAQLVLEENQRLGHLMKANVGEADDWGFRNESVEHGVDVIFLGDSQVFGFGVGRTESIPAQFARLSGRSAQNLGLIGYGPVQYRELSSRALDLQPKALVIGFYLGNDVIDAYQYAHLPSGADLRLPNHTYPTHQVLDLVGKESPNLAMALFDVFRDWSCLFDLAMRQIKNSMLYSDALAGIYKNEVDAPAHRAGRIGTLFTPLYRFATLDPDSEAVRDGLRIAELCLEQIASRAAARGVPVVLLLVHTKEYYYQRYYERTGETVPALAELDAAEQVVTRSLEALIVRSKMILVDPTAEIVDSLIAERALWPASSDGHPNAAGYGVFAQAVVTACRDLGTGKGR